MVMASIAYIRNQQAPLHFCSRQHPLCLNIAACYTASLGYVIICDRDMRAASESHVCDGAMGLGNECKHSSMTLQQVLVLYVLHMMARTTALMLASCALADEQK